MNYLSKYLIFNSIKSHCSITETLKLQKDVQTDTLLFLFFADLSRCRPMNYKIIILFLHNKMFNKTIRWMIIM